MSDHIQCYVCQSTLLYVLKHSSHRVDYCTNFFGGIARPHTSVLTGTELTLGTMVRTGCSCKFRVYEPFPEYRARCPKVLVVCKGQHTHPIPLPTKTPAKVRHQLGRLLLDLDYDLPDLTPRRLLRHPALQAFLRSSLPDVPNPILGDLHTSLANKDHIRAYITDAKNEGFPAGTGWSGMHAPFQSCSSCSRYATGLVHLKEQQDHALPKHKHYVRFVHEYSGQTVSVEVSDSDSSDSPTFTPAVASHPSGASPSPVAELGLKSPLRIVVCMTPESSRRLARAQYVQSDISFKRVVGFLELAIGGFDRDAQTSKCFSSHAA